MRLALSQSERERFIFGRLAMTLAIAEIDLLLAANKQRSIQREADRKCRITSEGADGKFMNSTAFSKLATPSRSGRNLANPNASCRGASVAPTDASKELRPRCGGHHLLRVQKPQGGHVDLAGSRKTEKFRTFFDGCAVSLRRRVTAAG